MSAYDPRKVRPTPPREDLAQARALSSRWHGGLRLYTLLERHADTPRITALYRLLAFELNTTTPKNSLYQPEAESSVLADEDFSIRR